METTKIPVSFRCKSCGAKLTWPDDAIDSTELSCQCGQYFGTYADLRDTALEGVKSKVESMFKDMFNVARSISIVSAISTHVPSHYAFLKYEIIPQGEVRWLK